MRIRMNDDKKKKEWMILNILHCFEVLSIK